MKRTFHSLALLACLALAGPVLAAGKPPAPKLPMTKQAYQAEQAKIDAEYQADRKLCAGMKGGRQDVCEAESKGRADALKAELDARYKPSPDATQKAKNVTADANYAVARAKCKLLRDGARDRCVQQAKLGREAAIRQAKVEKVQETGGPFATRAAAHRKLQAGNS